MANPLIDLLVKAGLTLDGAGAFAGALAAGSGVDFGQNFNKLTQAEGVFALQGDAPAIVRAALELIGEVVAEQADSGTGDYAMAGQTRAGWLNANPAILIGVVGKDQVQVIALAKEGLINQKTAPGALQRFASALAMESGGVKA